MDADIEAELERLGLDPVWRGRYWLIHCPQHEDTHKSTQCFPDGWIHCHAGCKRVHISKLVGREIKVAQSGSQRPTDTYSDDYTSMWLDLEPLDFDVKGVPASVLNKFGWRKYGDGDVFIPYFNKSKTAIPFYQIRHMSGDRRFTFAKGHTPITYGLDVLPQAKKYLFVTEGSRDSVILRWVGVNAIALPSASSTKSLEGIQQYCTKMGLILCWCGDRDEAGEKAMTTITCPYIDCRSKYKDIGDMLEAEGIEKIRNRYKGFIENA